METGRRRRSPSALAVGTRRSPPHWAPHGREGARRYLADPSLALWPFGYGLSYTSFALSALSIRAPASPSACADGVTGACAVEIGAPEWAADARAHAKAPLDARCGWISRFPLRPVPT
jgi:hypothetical protein